MKKIDNQGVLYCFCGVVDDSDLLLLYRYDINEDSQGEAMISASRMEPTNGQIFPVAKAKKGK